MALGLQTAPLETMESTGSVTNTGDPLWQRCCEKPWKSSYWRSPLSGETKPPTTEENGRNASEGRGRLNTMRHKEAENVGGMEMLASSTVVSTTPVSTTTAIFQAPLASPICGGSERRTLLPSHTVHTS
ncbi:hypothetical protein ACFX1Z_025438 [Malus domestica]